MFHFTKIYSETLISIYWTMSLASILFAIYKLCRPGISQKLRSMIVKRHILTVIIFVVTNLYPTIGIFYVYNLEYWDHGFEGKNEIWVYVLKSLYIS